MAIQNTDLTLLDCTLRDGGYYNNWDFPIEIANDYLKAMKLAGVNVCELGFRFLSSSEFKGPFAFTTDNFLRGLVIPEELAIAVMVNASDLCSSIGWQAAIENLFPNTASNSPVDIVRIACHFHEVESAFAAADWLQQKGYRVGINLMQIASRSPKEIKNFATTASTSSVEVIYFADSMGSMSSSDTQKIIQQLREDWQGAIGIHTHDNMGQAISNSLTALDEGVSWIDATITGMGRGPGNAQTELLVVALQVHYSIGNLVPLLRLIRTWFMPMKTRYGWGINPYYYIAGTYGVHPSYVQNMLDDSRFNEEDRIAVLEYLNKKDANHYSSKDLDFARRFFHDSPQGSWDPVEFFEGREVLILGTGPGALAHRQALEAYIERQQPLVVALNLNQPLNDDFIHLRVACHPVRLLADGSYYSDCRQPLILPKSMLPNDVIQRVTAMKMLDFGLQVEEGQFGFFKNHAILPRSLVIAYALALANSGRAKQIQLAGFDGYSPGDQRQNESESIFSVYQQTPGAVPIEAITPTSYSIPNCSVYSLVQ